MEHTWRVGQLADTIGLTVRALHFYEEIGLLIPSARSKGNHRRYSSEDLDRLLRIMILKRLGVPLTKIGSRLLKTECSAIEMITKQAAHVEYQITLLSRLQRTLRSAKEEVDQKRGMNPKNKLLIIKLISVLDKAALSVENTHTDSKEVASPPSFTENRVA